MSIFKFSSRMFGSNFQINRMRVAIYSRGLDFEQENPLLDFLEELARDDISILIFHQLLQQFTMPRHLHKKMVVFKTSDDLDEQIDCLISLGGDGTLLDTVTFVKDKNIPILGINFGRLGFLASISKEELASAVDSLINHTYLVDKRILMHLDSNEPLFGETPFALNEF